MKTDKNFALRVINSMLGSQLSERELNQAERKLSIISKEIGRTGLSNYPDIAKSIHDLGESLIELSKNKRAPLCDILSMLSTSKSSLEAHRNHILPDYHKECEKIHLKIKKTKQ